MKLRWEPLSFRIAAILFCLFAACWAFVPVVRMASKVGSWDAAWTVAAGSPVYWTAAILVRLTLGALLLRVALDLRRRRTWKGYVALALSAACLFVADLALLFVGLG